MGHGLHDLARHNSWATAQVLEYCRDLDEATLNKTVPGTYGTINEMLWHIIGSETSYLYRVSGAWPEYPWPDEETVGLDVLTERAAIVADKWEQFLAGDIDIDRLGEARSDRGEVFAVPAGVFITQAIHHGSEHRAQICTVIGALGYEAPDVSAWGYSMATGRSTLVSGPTDS